MSDDESSNGEDADLANLSLLDNDDESESSIDDKDESMNTLDDQSLNSNDDSNAMEVEHDESADAALASMIALKQSMQKKGQVSLFKTKPTAESFSQHYQIFLNTY